MQPELSIPFHSPYEHGSSCNRIVLLPFSYTLGRMYALIECNYETGFAIVGDAALSYRNYKVYIEGDNSFPDKVKRVGIGNVRFTRYGQELFDLLQSSRTVPLLFLKLSCSSFTIHLSYFIAQQQACIQIAATIYTQACPSTSSFCFLLYQLSLWVG